jgi:hypothetical protein
VVGSQTRGSGTEAKKLARCGVTRQQMGTLLFRCLNQRSLFRQEPPVPAPRTVAALDQLLARKARVPAADGSWSHAAFLANHSDQGGSCPSRAGRFRFASPDPALLYASHYAPVTPPHYPRSKEQEPTSGERGESESSIACDIQAGPYRLPSARLRGTDPPRGRPGR